jgi:hypothetical protein
MMVFSFIVIIIKIKFRNLMVRKFDFIDNQVNNFNFMKY